MFKLRQELKGHSKDARCVGELWTEEEGSFGGLVTGSRDATVRVWTETRRGGCELAETRRLVDSRASVSSVCCIGVGPGWPEGALLTGGLDTIIRCYSTVTFDLIKVFDGHNGTVCSIVGQSDGGDAFASGSWDCTARVWRPDGRCKEYVGHTASVWAVAFLPVDSQTTCDLLTASADKTIILWAEDGSQKRVFIGHSDCVRSLCVLSSDCFLSSANDNTIRMWDLPSAACIRSYSGHEDFVYSTSCQNYLDWFVSCSEDHTVRVWDKRSSECLQVIRIPCQTVWMVCVLKSGDVACACSDGVVRLFSTNSNRQASQSQLDVYEEQVTLFSKTFQKDDMVGDIKVSDLPGMEVLQKPGKRDGYSIMVRNARNGVELYSWSDADQKWSNIGMVVGSKGDETTKPTYLGKEYDYVFDVDVDDSQPPLKLPYNDGDDPWMTAQNFIHQNELPQSYLEQVANFIIKNTGGGQTAAPSADYVDPFTGNSRYSGWANGNDAPVDGADPYTGGGRYVPGQSAPVGQVVDPLRPVAENMPLKRFYLFEAVNAAGLMSKLKEFNWSVDAQLRLDDQSVRLLEEFTSRKPFDSNVAMLKAICTGLEWPRECLLPIVDCVRLALLGERGNSFFFDDYPGEDLCLLLGDQLEQCTSDQYSGLLQTVICRTFANAFAQKSGRAFLFNRPTSFVQQICGQMSCAKATVQTAAAAVVANLAYLYHQQSDEEITNEKKRILLDTVVKEIRSILNADIALNRTTIQYVLQAMVTVLWSNQNIVLYAKMLDIASILQRMKDLAEEESDKHIARSIEAMLGSVAR